MGIVARVGLVVGMGAALVWVGGRAHAHDEWADGSPVPAWVKAACCGPEDVHHLRPEQVHLTSKGWQVEGYPDLIPIGKELPSPDGGYWIFYKRTETSTGPYFSSVFCFFTPFSGS